MKLGKGHYEITARIKNEKVAARIFDSQDYSGVKIEVKGKIVTVDGKQMTNESGVKLADESKTQQATDFQNPGQRQLLSGIIKDHRQSGTNNRELNLWEEHAINKFPTLTADMFLNANNSKDQFKLYHLAALEHLVNDNSVPANLAFLRVVRLSREEADNICNDKQSNLTRFAL